MQQNNNIKLHYWYIEKHVTPEGTANIAWGTVTGHPRLLDTINIHTSRIKTLHTDFEKGELILETMNNEYHCPLEYCLWWEQDKYPELIPDYDKVKEKYMDKIQYPSIEPGKILLVFADFCPYYYHSAYYVPLDSPTKESLEFYDNAHVGMFHDSYLISTEDMMIDLRYFPSRQHISFYSQYTDDKPLYLENIGSTDLYASTLAGVIKLGPGERKEVIPENKETDPPELDTEDLYPAKIL